MEVDRNLEVQKSLVSAKRKLTLAKAELLTQLGRVTTLSNQAKCEHKNLELEEAYLYDYINCKDCGYQWVEL